MARDHYLVVGGTRGTGKVLVERLAALAGTHVTSFGRTAVPEAERVTPVTLDVTDREKFVAAMDSAVASAGKVRSIIFLQRHRGEESLEAHLDVALTTTAAAVDHLVAEKLFAAEGSKSIVFVSSIADHYVAPEQSAGYHVAKAGLAQLARYYALKLGPRGIRVNCVSPCVVAKEEAAEFYQNNRKLVDRLNSVIPLGRMGKSNDIVDAILFLASEQASYITGQNLVVDGGLTLRSHESIIRDFSDDH
jgi:Dehydrogenases with different specificities (related to short-chain alcohol dehydrogenases)